MRSLSDTISRLVAHRAQRRAEPSTSDAYSLVELTNFGSNPGALRAKTYIPENLTAHSPLVVVLHGCTQTAAGYNFGAGWSDLADAEGFALLFPEQQRTNNANLCFNWFDTGDMRRNAGEPLSIRQMIETMVTTHRLDRKRIFITGLSAGGAMTSVMLATYPDVFAGGAIIAGLPYGSANSIPEAFDRMRGHGGPSKARLQQMLRAASPHTGPWPTISVWHGSSDLTVVSSNADDIVQQWRTTQGIDDQSIPSETVVDGHTRRVWKDGSGRDVIEQYDIAGMGHGTPLATAKEAGRDGLGTAGPFMIDVGISSTHHIAHFWGIAKLAEFEPKREPRGIRPQDKAMAPSRAAPADGIRKTIEDALRSAGLMR
ncbi:poly(hydroxyalkanoate) depolymerase family esterase [Aminobacter niigataensis]|uniref:Poly(Hydroxyalkanoate) depolymerase family esterase n=1 Tax=Aminobacter niigataensis TaxID=83265 RepID=A0ABR6L0G5_9HYPH|nr:PHB depolymerase family esterase [Aminobacter niigataensis]MBB4649545.1 poly(hydroxyalkanoate) depolymerase family esterase [Aminobacter niigataensis]